MSKSTRKPFPKPITLPRGRLLFAHLVTPDAYRGGDPHWKASSVIDAETLQPVIEQLEAIRETRMHEEAEAVAQEKADAENAGKRYLEPTLAFEDLPIRVEYVRDDDGDETDEETGNLIISSKMKSIIVNRKTKKETKLQPDLFDAQKNRITFGTDIPWGSEVRLCVQPNPYVRPDTSAPKKEPRRMIGCGLRLKAVQVITMGGAGGGSADSYGFDEVEDGYAHDNSASDGGSIDHQNDAANDPSDDEDADF